MAVSRGNTRPGAMQPEGYSNAANMRALGPEVGPNLDLLAAHFTDAFKGAYDKTLERLAKVAVTDPTSARQILQTLVGISRDDPVMAARLWQMVPFEQPIAAKNAILFYSLVMKQTTEGGEFREEVFEKAKSLKDDEKAARFIDNVMHVLIRGGSTVYDTRRAAQAYAGPLLQALFEAERIGRCYLPEIYTTNTTHPLAFTPRKQEIPDSFSVDYIAGKMDSPAATMLLTDFAMRSDDMTSRLMAWNTYRLFREFSRQGRTDFDEVIGQYHRMGIPNDNPEAQLSAVWLMATVSKQSIPAALAAMEMLEKFARYPNTVRILAYFGVDYAAQVSQDRYDIATMRYFGVIKDARTPEEAERRAFMSE